MNNLYDELYEDLVYGMCQNREEKKKQEKLNKKLSNMDGIIMPNEISKNDSDSLWAKFVDSFDDYMSSVRSLKWMKPI